MALFYAISVEHADVDGQALIGSAMWMASVPVANDRNFVNDVHQSVFAEWKNDGLQAAVQLAWSILLQGLSLIPSMAGKLCFSSAACLNFTIVVSKPARLRSLAYTAEAL